MPFDTLWGWKTVLDQQGYPRTTKMTFGTHAKVHNWTEPFTKSMEFWEKKVIQSHKPSTLRWDHLSWSSLSCPPPALLFQLSICYQWEPGLQLRYKLLKKPILSDLSSSLSPFLFPPQHRIQDNCFRSITLLSATCVEAGQHSLPPSWPV